METMPNLKEAMHHLWCFMKVAKSFFLLDFCFCSVCFSFREKMLVCYNYFLIQNTVDFQKSYPQIFLGLYGPSSPLILGTWEAVIKCHWALWAVREING